MLSEKCILKIFGRVCVQAHTKAIAINDFDFTSLRETSWWIVQYRLLGYPSLE